MTQPAQLRFALAQYLGQTLTPEAAAHIEAMALAGEPVDVSRFAPEQVGDHTIRAERFADILPELHDLHALHWQETEAHRHGLALKPDYEAMAADERIGRMVQFTVRHRDALIGHLRMYIGWSRHTSTKLAQEDTLFIRPEHRGAMLGLRLMRYAERCLLSIGVREISADSKLINHADVLMRRMGYTPVATQFVKVFPESEAR